MIKQHHIEKDLNKMQEELDKKLDAVTYKIAVLQKTWEKLLKISIFFFFKIYLLKFNVKKL